MDKQALFRLTYGLYLLTARESGVDNGCIINTAVQVAGSPDRIAISVIKQNKTHDMIKNTGFFCISAITQEADFALFQRFGMQSGRNVDKFAGYPDAVRTPSTVYRLDKACCMYMTAVVTQEVDLGTHTLFIAEVTDGAVLSDGQPCTYDYYQKSIKPRPKPAKTAQWECVVCGYVYEGEELPDDFLCPLCKHGKEDFVRKG